MKVKDDRILLVLPAQAPSFPRALCSHARGASPRRRESSLLSTSQRSNCRSRSLAVGLAWP